MRDPYNGGSGGEVLNGRVSSVLFALLIGVCLAIAAVLLGGCAQEPKVIAVAVIPDLPKVDPALMTPPENPKCVKSKAKDISVRDLAQERDCMSLSSLKNHKHLVALQESVKGVEASIDALRTEANAKLDAEKKKAGTK